MTNCVQKFIPAKRSWTDEQAKFALKLWVQGVPASVIAERMNAHFSVALTRNAVIGRLNRMRLAGAVISMRQTLRSVRTARAKKEKIRAVARKILKARAAPPAPPPVDFDVSSFVPPQDRGEDIAYGATRAVASVTGCRWPYGDPGSDKFHFCDAPQSGKSSYCAHHRSIAFRSVPKA